MAGADGAQRLQVSQVNIRLRRHRAEPGEVPSQVRQTALPFSKAAARTVVAWSTLKGGVASRLGCRPGAVEGVANHRARLPRCGEGDGDFLFEKVRAHRCAPGCDATGPPPIPGSIGPWA